MKDLFYILAVIVVGALITLWFLMWTPFYCGLTNMEYAGVSQCN